MALQIAYGRIRQGFAGLQIARATEVVSLFMYRTAFMSLESGRAAAVAVVMLALNVALALLALRMLRRQAGSR